MRRSSVQSERYAAILADLAATAHYFEQLADELTPSPACNRPVIASRMAQQIGEMVDELRWRLSREADFIEPD